MNIFFRFWRELRRRNVHKAIISYIIFSWLLLQVISVLGSIIEMPPWLGKAVLIALFVFFPFWVVFSWLYDITPDGIKLTAVRDEIDIVRREKVGKRLNAIIFGFLIVAIILLFVDRFRLSSFNDEKLLDPDIALSNSIAVLPFSDISAQQDQAYFEEGLAEELIMTLSKITGVRVTSRTSAFSFKGTTIDIPTIAKRLNVNYILEGSVRTQDSLVRVNVQLIDTRNDVSTWSDSWDKPLSNIFEIQNEISTNVAERLALYISKQAIPKVTTTNPEAYKLYLEGKYVMHSTFDIEGDIKASKLFKKSLAIDSTYAPAWERLAWTYHFQADHGIISKDRAYKLVKDATYKALGADSTYASTYELLGFIAMTYENDYKKAQEFVNQGLKIAPNHPDVLNSASLLAIVFNQMDKAIPYNENIAALDPLKEYFYFALGTTYYYANKYPEAEKSLLKALELTPEAEITYRLLSGALLKQGRYEEALKAARLEKSKPLRLQALAIAHHSLGDKEDSDKALKQLKDTFEKEYSYAIASVYAHRKENDDAFLWLERAMNYGDFDLIDLHIEPYFEPIREDTRWSVFLDRIGIPK